MIRYPKHMKQKTKPPEGFDIILANAILQLDLNEEEIMELGRLSTTRRSGLAHATFGHNVWYRERQLRELFGRKLDVEVTPDE